MRSALSCCLLNVNLKPCGHFNHGNKSPESVLNPPSPPSRHFAARPSSQIGTDATCTLRTRGSCLYKVLWIAALMYQMPRTPASRVAEWGNLPAFLRHFKEARPLLVFTSRNSESRQSSVRRIDNKKRRCPYPELFYLFSFFLFVCTALVILNALTHLITWRLDSGHQMYALHGPAVRAIQCKVVLFVFRAGLLKRLT